MTENTEPFFAQFLEAQHLETEDLDEVTGGKLGGLVTLAYPSDSDSPRRHPFPDPSMPLVTLAYPSDRAKVGPYF